MKNNIVTIIAISLIVGGLSFYGGIKYQESKAKSFTGQFGGGQGMMRNNREGFRPVAGEIISADEKSITVKLQDDSSKIILINDKTVINKAQTVTKSELKIGEKVSVFGSENTDGSVTAQNVQLNPILRSMNGGN